MGPSGEGEPLCSIPFNLVTLILVIFWQSLLHKILTSELGILKDLM